MTLQEFSDQFDVLYNNITSNQAPGLDEYEKSVFLTKAQDEIVKNYFNSKANKMQEGYDGGQKRQIDFSMLTNVLDVDTFSTPVFDKRDNSKGVSFPTGIMMVVNEKIKVTRDEKTLYLVVVPISFEEYDKLMSKPYKRPLKYQAWRLLNKGTSNKADLVVGPNDVIAEYSIRYVRKPQPIIISDLGGLTIEGEPGPSDCELDEEIHSEILQRAIELAKVAWVGDANSSIQAGQRSE